MTLLPIFLKKKQEYVEVSNETDLENPVPKLN